MRRALFAVPLGVRRSLLKQLQASSAIPAAAAESSAVAHRAGAFALHSSRLQSTQTDGSGVSPACPTSVWVDMYACMLVTAHAGVVDVHQIFEAETVLSMVHAGFE